jgi:hypothetical protein
LDVVRRQVDAYNRQDLEAFLSCYAPGCPVEDDERGVIVQGMDELRVFYGDYFRDHPGLRAEIRGRLTCGPYVVDSEVVRWDGGEERGLVVYRIQDGLIAHVRFLESSS